jgi:hypothetical protein
MNKHKNIEGKNYFFGILKVTDEKSRYGFEDPDPYPDTYKNATDPKYCEK